MYDYLWKIIKKIEVIPTEEDIKKNRRHTNSKIYLVLFYLIIVGSLCSVVLNNNWIFWTILFSPLVISILFLLVKRQIIKIRLKKIDKSDMDIVLKFINTSDFFARDLDCYLTFENFYFICKDFLIFPRKISIPPILDFNNVEKSEIEKATKNKENNNNEKFLYDYYVYSLEALKIIRKYYDENGKKKKL